MAPAPVSSINADSVPLGDRWNDLAPLHHVAEPTLFGLGAAGMWMVRVATHASTDQQLQLLRDDEANPIAISRALDALSDKAWRDWEPQTLQDEFGPLSTQQLDKMMAVQVAVTNADVFECWSLFHHCISAFNHRRADFAFFDAPSLAEAAWACTVLRELQPHRTFGPEVTKYLCVLCINEGLLHFPWVGGEGLSVCSDPGVKGLVDPAHAKISDKIRRAWADEALQELSPSAIDESDPWHVQAGKVVAVQAYIRSQQPRDPAAFKMKEG